MVFKFDEMSCFNQHNAVEYKYHFACKRKGIRLCFIMNPGKMIFAVLFALTVSFKLIFV